MFCLKKIKLKQQIDEKNSSDKNLQDLESKFITEQDENKFKASQNSIAIVILNLVLFETLRPLLEEFLKKGLGYDLFVPKIDFDTNAERMAMDTYEYLVKIGLKPVILDIIPTETYKIAFYPYLPYYKEVKSKYKIRYQYGMAKPNHNFGVWSLNFDLILCNGPYDESFLKVYTETEIIGPIKFANYNIKNKNKKDIVRVLYLPTYGSECSIEYIKDNLKDLNNEFDITIKLHHMTSFLEQGRVKIAKEISKKIKNHRDSIVELFNETDVILSDGSGAIFDAIAAEIPIVIFQPVHHEEYEGMIPLEQQIIIDNLVPSTDNPIDLKQKILSAINDEEYLKKRKELKEKLFPIMGRKTIERAIIVIEKFLNDDIDENYIRTQRKLRKKFIQLNADINAFKMFKEQNRDLIKTISGKDEAIVSMTKMIDDRDEAIVSMTRMIDDRDKAIRNMAKMIEYRDEVIKNNKN